MDTLSGAGVLPSQHERQDAATGKEQDGVNMNILTFQLHPYPCDVYFLHKRRSWSDVCTVRNRERSFRSYFEEWRKLIDEEE